MFVVTAWGNIVMFFLVSGHTLFSCDALFTVPLLYKRGKGGYEFCNWSQSRVDNIDFLSDLTLLCLLRTGNAGPRVVIQWTLKWLHSQRKYAGCSFLSCGTYFVFKVFKKTIRRLGSLYMGMWIISFFVLLFANIRSSSFSSSLIPLSNHSLLNTYHI